MKLCINVFSLSTDELVEEISLDSIYTENELINIFQYEEDFLYGASEITAEMEPYFSRLNLKFNFKKYGYYVCNYREDD